VRTIQSTVNPVVVEERFCELLAFLPLMMSRRSRLLRICEFLEPLLEQNERDAVAAYSPELLQECQKNLLELTAEGTPTEFFLRIEKLVLRVQAVSADSLESEGWTQFIARARGLSNESEAFSRRRGHPALALDGRATSLRQTTPIIPVVELEPFAPAQSANFASVCRLRIDVSLRQKGESEDGLFLGQNVDPDGKQQQAIQSAVGAARRLYESLNGRVFRNSVNIHCAFSESSVIAGGSMGLAAATAIYCELVRLSEDPSQMSLSPRAAFTGSLAEDGSILAVDHEGLRKKLEACIYAPVDYVVIPKSQLAEAEKLYAEHARPKGVVPPNVIGVERLEEVFFDRRITRLAVTPIVKRLAKKAWKHRRMLAFSLFVILIGTIAVLGIPRLDRDPVFAEYKDNWLVVKNRFGYELERELAGSAFAKIQQLNLDRHSRLVECCDVDRDGTNEVLYLCGEGVEDDPVRLVCKSIRRRQTLWEERVVRRVMFPDRPGVVGESFNIAGFLVQHSNATEEDQVVLFANGVYFPALVLSLNARTGEERGAYLHVGQIGDITDVDLDRDGIKEVVACGTNNAFKSAAVIVLDPREISGCSPTIGSYCPEGYVRAREKGYILIPRTIAGATVRDLYGRNGANRIDCDTVSRTLSVMVTDFNLRIPEFNISSSAVILLSFDYSLRALSIGTTDSYDRLVERMVRLGWMKEVPNAAYFTRYLKSFPRWNGREFVPSPQLY
jgi:hypothetical protein